MESDSFLDAVDEDVAATTTTTTTTTTKPSQPPEFGTEN